VGRRRFEHLVGELSLALGQPVPRFRLWQALHDAGCDPERLARDQAVGFCDAHLPGFLAGLGRSLDPAAARRLRRRVARFDARYPTPEEVFARL
jgi:hypothetical protein